RARLGRRRGRGLPAIAGISAVRGGMVLWRLCGLRDRLGRGGVVRFRPRLAQHRRPGPQHLPDAAGHRLPGGARGESIAGAVPATRLVSRIDRRRLCDRVRGRRVRRRTGADVAEAALVFVRSTPFSSVPAVVTWASYPNLATIDALGGAVGKFEYRLP